MSDAHLREIVAHTYGMVGLVDEQVGRILDCVDEQDLTEDTVVVFMSDHGDLMGDHWLINKGPYHFDGLVRVPFLWSWPGRFEADRQTPALASLLDFAPTVLDLAGVAVPEGRAPAEPEAPEMPPAWPGVSLVPILTGRTERVQPTLLIENDEDYLGLRLRTLVTETHKLTVYPGQTYGELFNKREDPDELHNRWRDPAYRKLRERMVNLLMERLALSDSAIPRRLCHA
jgi:arylsulfatase